MTKGCFQWFKDTNLRDINNNPATKVVLNNSKNTIKRIKTTPLFVRFVKSTFPEVRLHVSSLLRWQGWNGV